LAQQIIGLDLGTHEVKVTAIEGSFRGFAVRRYVSAPVPQDPPGEEERPFEERLLEALEKLVEAEPGLFKADGIYTAVPGFLVSTHQVTLPFTDTRRIEQTLPFQLEDQLPFDLDEVVFDHQVLRQAGGKTELLMGLVRRETMASLLEVLEKAGIDPRVVTLSALAYQNLYAHGVIVPGAENGAPAPAAAGEENGSAPRAGDDPAWTAEETPEGAAAAEAVPTEKEPEAEAILDVGHLSTDLCILEGGTTRYARSFPVAGRGLSIAIAAAEKIPLVEAEALKHEAVDLVAVDDDRGRRIAAAIERGLAPLVRGVRQSFFAFSSRTRHRVARVYLTGGTARLPGLAKHLARELSCEVLPLDPFPAHLEESVPKERADDPAAALAMALALCGQGTTRMARMNLRKGPFAFKGDLSHLKGSFVRLGVLGAVVVALLLTNVFVRFHALSVEEAQVDAQLCELTERVLGVCTTNSDDAISRLRGQRSAASIVPAVSAAEILSEVVRRLSSVDDVEVTELDIGGTRVRLQGEAASFDAVARVVTELQGYDCFREVSQGQTRQARQSQKIEFNVDAALAAQCES
jgi:general secretion pathway protein L